MHATLTTLAYIAAASILGADAINLEKRTDRAPRVVQHDIYRKHIPDPVARISQDYDRMRKRADTVSVTLANEETLYFVNGTIGTPAQNFRWHLDTGSSDLWVNVANSQFCEQRSNDCSVSGTYSANDSSTYTYLNNDFNITYADGTGAQGDYAKDVVSFAGVTLDDQQFGIGYQSTTQECILGIGYPINEVAVAYTQGQSYPNVPQAMVNKGYIAANAYSLWLNDLDASTGQILFGGVNSDKYTGSLETLPIIKESGYYAEFIIALTGMGQNGSPGTIASNVAIPALLDSGSSLMYLPDNIVQAIYQATNAQYNAAEGAAYVDCSLANADTTIDFTFSSPTIRVAMSELVLVAGEDHGQEVCILGISFLNGSLPAVLGDTFLRSAYVVYDLTANEISLAQTNFNSTSDNILEITPSSGVPDATVVTNAVTDVAVATGGARIGDGLTSAGLAAPTASYNIALMGAVGAAAMFAL